MVENQQYKPKFIWKNLFGCVYLSRKENKKQSETLIVYEKMFNFGECFLRKMHTKIILERSSNNKTANFVRVRGTRNVHEDNQTLFAHHFGADCLFIRMCTGCLAVPVVVWTNLAVRTFLLT